MLQVGLRAGTAPGNRRRAASGSCAATQAHTPRRGCDVEAPAHQFDTKKAVLMPAASANPLTNNEALASSRHDPLARSLMT